MMQAIMDLGVREALALQDLDGLPERLQNTNATEIAATLGKGHYHHPQYLPWDLSFVPYCLNQSDKEPA